MYILNIRAHVPWISLFNVIIVVASSSPSSSSLGSLSKPRRRRQRELHQTNDLMSKTITVHVRYKSLYISLPSSAKQQREMTKFCVLYGTWTTTANVSYFHLEITRRHCTFSSSTFLEPLVY